MIPADNDLGLGWVNDFFPTIDSTSQDWNDETIPSSNLSNGQYSHIALQNIVWNYETNPQDTSTTIGELLLNNGALVISADTTWSSTVELDRDVAITDGAVLTVEPGTIIKVDTVNSTEKIEISVYLGGRIEINGTETSPVVCQSAIANPGSDDWNGFIFSNGGIGVFNYAVIKNASKAISADFNSEGYFQISSSIMEDTDIVIENADDSTFFRDCEFQDGCFLQINNSSILIERNSFLDESHIRLFSDSSVIKNNLMVGEGGVNHGIWIATNKPSLTQIVNNTISFYIHGIFIIGSGHSPLIKNNILFRNSSTGSFQGTVQYNDFWNNDSSGYQLPDSTNIKANPGFVDAGGDFHLKSISPCIDRGDSLDDYSNEPEPNGDRINMGAYGNTPEATLSFNVIADDDFTADTTWEGYVNVINDISTNGYSLTVEPGTKILFDDGKSLSITGDFTSDGHPNPELGPDNIEFRGYRETDKMGGVFVNGEGAGNVNTVRYTAFKQGDIGLHIENISDPDNPLEYLLLENNNTGLYLSASEIEISNSTFKNNESGLISDYSDANIYSCDFSGNIYQGLYLFNSSFDIYENTFQDNVFRGVYFQSSSDGFFHDNTIIDNGVGSGSEPSEIRGGLVFYQSEPIISSNFITGNEASGIYSLSSSYPIMNYHGSGINLVSENGDAPDEYPEIMVEDISFPILDGGHNDIADSTKGYLIYGDEDPRDIEIDITYNYWGTTDEEEIEERVFRPSGFVFVPFDYEPNTDYSPGSGGGEEMFAAALSAEMDSNYVYAISVYDSIVQQHPASLHAKAALGRIFLLKTKTQESMENIKAYFDTLSNHSDSALATVAKRLSIRTLTLDEQYQSAINEHTQWRQTTPYVCDSIYSEVDILTNQLKQSGGYLSKKASGSSTNVADIEEKRAELTAFREYQRKSELILNALFDRGQLYKQAHMPRTFQLMQNYPNPFNPVTTIKYQLPIASRIKLEIYNVLGQKVITLVDAQQPADYYTVQWDGKNSHGGQVGTGLYIYRLITRALDGSKTFVKSKKMLMIR